MEHKAEPSLEQVQEILGIEQQQEAPRKPTLIKVKPTTLDTKQPPPPPEEEVEQVDQRRTISNRSDKPKPAKAAKPEKPAAEPEIKVLSRKVIGRLPPRQAKQEQAQPAQQEDSDSDYDEFGIKTSSQATRNATFGPSASNNFLKAKVENPIDPAVQGMFNGSPKNQFEPKQQVFRRGGVKPINEAASQQLIQAANAELNQRMAQIPQVVAPTGFTPVGPQPAYQQQNQVPLQPTGQYPPVQPMPQYQPIGQFQPMSQYPPTGPMSQYPPTGPMPQYQPVGQYQPMPQYQPVGQYPPMPQYQPVGQQGQIPPQIEEELRWMREQLKDLMHTQQQLIKASGRSEFENFRHEYEADRRQLTRALERLEPRGRY